MGDTSRLARPSIQERRDSVPGELDRIVRKCLARVPADRYATMAELLGELAKDRAGGVPSIHS